MREWLYRRLLRLYPKEFRGEFGEQLVEIFLYRWRRASRLGGPLWRTRFWSEIAADLVGTVWAERRPSPQAAVDRVYNQRGGGVVEAWVQDFRYSLRRLMRSPGFTLGALAILTIGIGVNSAAFSIVNALLLQPPPFEEPARLVEVLQDSDGGRPSSTSFPAYRDIREHTQLFAGVAARWGASAVMEEDGSLTPLNIEFTTSTLLPVLGLTPARGRWFNATEDELGGAPVAVISHRMWRNRFASDPDVLGRSLLLNGGKVTIVGVGPASYSGGPAAGDAWLSLSSLTSLGARAGSMERRADHPLVVVARLAPGVSMEAAASGMTELGRRLAAEFPEANRNRRIHVLPVHALGAEARSGVLPAAAVVMSVMALALLIAAVNLANLILVRGMTRRRELGIRLAFGGSRARLIRTLFGETLILVGLGALLGLGSTVMLLDVLGHLRLPLGFPLTLDVHLDASVVAFTFLAAAGTSLIAGLMPAISATRQPAARLLTGKPESTLPRRFGLVGLLVAAQLATSVLLLVTAGTFVEGLMRAAGSDPGFDPDNLAIVRADLRQMDLSAEAYGEALTTVDERMQALPTAQYATVAFFPPMGMRGTTTLLVGDMVDGRRRPVEVPWNVVATDYFETLGIPLIHGRLFSAQDRADGPSVAVVSEAMARAFWGRPDVVGEVYHSESNPDLGIEIIGVVGTTKVSSLSEGDRATVYWSTGQNPMSSAYFVVRSSASARSVLGPMRELISAFDTRVTVLETTTMTDVLGASLNRDKLASGLLVVVGAFGLALATLGVFAVVSFGVSQRMSEIGVRLALGAERSSVLGLFLKDAAGVILLGVFLGTAAAVPMAKLLVSIRGGSGFQLSVFLVALVVMSAAVFLATAIPAQRASRLDPANTLRQT